MRLKQVFLALGTNLGDRLHNLQQAIFQLPPAVLPLRASQVYETPPWGIEDQPRFLNMVIETATALPPVELLNYLKTLEKRLGRVENVRYGPRLIDMDILFYEDQVLSEETLQIPHPRLHERSFVLLPLNDLIPGFQHPLLKKTITALLKTSDLSGIIPQPLPAGFQLLPYDGWYNLPADLRGALEDSDRAAAAFYTLPSSHRQRWINHIQEARRADTRLHRIAKMVESLAEGH
ncbi:2-amino-4-hydroxy-6-hydroxymethyldihydropteridine diphosphokinase [Bellilinea caldifistulae]|nr:2-amino-4-hydroxy-6-hydroxymethyldihydropteridine diphosphokinase [Bellilinea caldifistulae]